MLGDLGADVITIETAVGDTNRFMGPGSHSELSGVSMNLMRNKGDVVLDLKQDAGRHRFLADRRDGRRHGHEPAARRDLAACASPTTTSAWSCYL